MFTQALCRQAHTSHIRSNGDRAADPMVGHDLDS
jgi:hypothetical protein